MRHIDRVSATLLQRSRPFGFLVSTFGTPGIPRLVEVFISTDRCDLVREHAMGQVCLASVEQQLEAPTLIPKMLADAQCSLVRGQFAQ